MVILVGMSAWKSVFRKQDKKREIGSHTWVLFCPFLLRGLDVRTVCWSRNVLSSTKHLGVKSSLQLLRNPVELGKLNIRKDQPSEPPSLELLHFHFPGAWNPGDCEDHLKWHYKLGEVSNRALKGSSMHCLWGGPGNGAGSWTVVVSAAVKHSHGRLPPSAEQWGPGLRLKLRQLAWSWSWEMVFSCCFTNSKASSSPVSPHEVGRWVACQMPAWQLDKHPSTSILDGVWKTKAFSLFPGPGE